MSKTAREMTDAELGEWISEELLGVHSLSNTQNGAAVRSLFAETAQPKRDELAEVQMRIARVHAAVNTLGSMMLALHSESEVYKLAVQERQAQAETMVKLLARERELLAGAGKEDGHEEALASAYEQGHIAGRQAY